MGSSEIETSARLLRGILQRREAGRAGAPIAAPPDAAGAAPPAGIDGVLAALCAAPGVRTAVVADASGLPVAGRGGDDASDRLAACSVLLGSVLEPAARLLGGPGRDRAAVRLGDGDEALLLRFRAADRTWHLILLHDARIDAREPAERAAEALADALARRTAPRVAP